MEYEKDHFNLLKIPTSERAGICKNQKLPAVLDKLENARMEMKALEETMKVLVAAKKSSLAASQYGHRFRM